MFLPIKTLESSRESAVGRGTAYRLLIAVLAVPALSMADSHTWIGADPGGPWWDYVGNWTPALQPAGGDTAMIAHTGASNAVVWYYNTLYPTAVLTELRVDGTGTGTIELQINGSNHPLAAGTEYIGHSGRGYMYQNTGTNTAGSLYLAYLSTGAGRYTLSNVGVLKPNLFSIGHGGAGTFLQAGGSMTAATDLLIAWNGSSQGLYQLDSGSALIGNNAAIGGHGIGTLSQGGGSLRVNNDLAPGFYADGAGWVGLSGSSSLSVGHDAIIGRYGFGQMDQSGGIHGVQNNLVVGQYVGSTGFYNLNQGTLTVSNAAYIGGSEIASGGAGQLSANGGTLLVRGGRLTIWENGTLNVASTRALVSSGNAPAAYEGLTIGRATGSGTVTLRGSLLSSWTFVGWDGAGTFTQQQGLHHVSNMLTVGHWPGATGYYRLESGTLTVDNDEVISFDQNANAIFDQFGGVHTVSGALRIGDFAVGSNGVFNLVGGTLNSSAAAVGGNTSASFGLGTLNVAGGTANISGTLKVWNTGTVNYTAGGLRVGSIDIDSGGQLLLGAGGGKVLRSQNLVIAGTGRLDLSDNAMIIDYAGGSPLSTIRGYIATGRNGGNWLGNALTSSTAAANPSSALGIAEATAIGSPATFLGQPIDNTTLLVRHTLLGDADLSGGVNLDDFTRLAAAFGTSSTWSSGDFTYDSVTNLDDFTVLAANFGLSIAAPPPGGARSAALESVAPEPSVSLMATALALALLPRRQR